MVEPTMKHEIHADATSFQILERLWMEDSHLH